MLYRVEAARMRPGKAIRADRGNIRRLARQVRVPAVAFRETDFDE